MHVKQLSIFLENRSGRLREVTDILGKAGINIRALSLADTSDFGILRLIVNKPDEAHKILKDAEFTIHETDVLAVEVQDQPGGLAQVLRIFESGSINVEYMYGFLEKASNNALMIFRVEDLNRSAQLLQDNGFQLLSGETVYSL